MVVCGRHQQVSLAGPERGEIIEVLLWACACDICKGSVVDSSDARVVIGSADSFLLTYWLALRAGP